MTVVQNCDILFLHEHYLYESHLCDMAKIGGGMVLVAKCAMDANICKMGRKYGGCAILWKPDIKGETLFN